MKNIIIACNDVFGLEVYSILKEVNNWYKRRKEESIYNIIGYISDSEKPFGKFDGFIPRLGSIEEWTPLKEGETYVLGILKPESKQQTVESLTKKGCCFEMVRTPWVLSPPIKIGVGSFVAAYSIKGGMKIGNYVTLIESMLTSRSIGDYSTVLRFSNITGNIGKSVFIGNHVYSHLGKTIGDNAYVMDGSIVVKDIKPGITVAGVPARKARK